MTYRSIALMLAVAAVAMASVLGLAWFMLAAAGASTTTDSAPAGPASPVNLSANEATGKYMANLYYHWTGPQWNALYDLWQRESNWNSLADNSQSGAFGIAQALGHGTATAGVVDPTVDETGGIIAHNVFVDMYPTVAANSGNPLAQIMWGLSYIKSQYGSPEKAWGHEVAYSWY